MVKLVIECLKSEIEQLESLKRMVDNVLQEGETRQIKEIHIKSGEYSNGLYIQEFEPGFGDCVDFLKGLSKRYDVSIKEKTGILDGLLEEVEINQLMKLDK